MSHLLHYCLVLALCLKEDRATVEVAKDVLWELHPFPNTTTSFELGC
jgi:hypothetical protein